MSRYDDLRRVRETKFATTAVTNLPRLVMKSDLLPPSPPAEQSTARQDQAGQSSTGDGTGDGAGGYGTHKFTNYDLRAHWHAWAISEHFGSNNCAAIKANK
jgi:hypothetical protein